jgi:hypothetical protein
MTPPPTPQPPIAVPCDNGALLLIEPPEGWLMSPPAPPSRLLLLDPAAPVPRPNINVIVQDLGKMTAEEYLTLTRLQLKGMGDNVVVERDEPLGRPPGGQVLEFTAQLGPMSVRCRQFILLHGGSAYVITALATAHQFEAYRSRFERALTSVTLTLSPGP